MSGKNDRACMVCGVIRSFDEFAKNGCPNCESVLNYAGSEDIIQDCTSPSFEGIVALGEPGESWVGRWLRIESFQPGLYAVKVNGRLPEDIIEELESKGITYRPRDGSSTD
ncbi:hypothetical protein CANCADRAFT_49373 [Tortispora caseinolytica NRRL Y-17796]|uniref:Transcription elongation factor SPT4 n=1 Tax=Tortispora caseinolytica NRRL Y-17796 TaxID=767744 RepID=A0A1E4TMG9_9ASCO|nr:hypothetical protein CANCADRAFT_49373 [Tortispora caseinolytica NRRL Y-17796]